ncbi:MAG: hypothetical protein IPK82_40215 [Polyangiaceae bacterium]|nr:hypothetical protein [Polyangiaceae bacterium]
MVTSRTLEKEAHNPFSSNFVDDKVDPVRSALAKAGVLLLDLADQATKLGVLVADLAAARTLAGSLCRRAELARQLGRRLAISPSTENVDSQSLVNEAILALDGIGIDVEYAADFSVESKIKNQVARSRLAVTMAGCAIDDARRVIAAQA